MFLDTFRLYLQNKTPLQDVLVDKYKPIWVRKWYRYL